MLRPQIARSIRLTPAVQPTAQQVGLPDGLGRSDGASVFTVAGTDHYTSTRTLAAEQRLLTAAEQLGGRALDPGVVDQRLAEAAVGGIILDAGQSAMVRNLATDHRRVQLVIAPAGAGKTTALNVLARTWTAGGGHVLGLTPSAAAAAQLTQATGIQTDTLARLTWAIRHQQRLPDWAARIGPRTLLLVDEAGMADTLTLDTAISYVAGRYGRVCLVGDDRQLGAVGAGGILKDLEAAHGAVRLTRLHCFTDPDEAAATLKIRHGDPAAIDFYVDGTGSRSRTRLVSPTACSPRGATTSTRASTR